MTYAEFVAKVKENLPVDAERLNIGVVATGTSFVDNKLRSALIELQDLVDGLRVGHETIYRVDDLVVDGFSSLGVRPEGAVITRAWYAKTGEPANRTGIGTYDWANRFDLVNGGAHLDGCDYIISLDPNSSDFAFYPKVVEGYDLHLEWNGLKLEFNTGDILPALMDEKVAECVAEYVSAHVERKVNKDLQMYESHMASYRRQRALLNARTNEATRIARRDAPQPAAQICVPAVPDTSEIEFVFLADSGEQVTIAQTQAVSELINRIEPDFVVHGGDASYSSATEVLLQDNFTKFWSNWLQLEQFFFAPGNHDLDANNAADILALMPYLALLNGGKLYYKFTKGPAEFFVLNGNFYTNDTIAIPADGVGVGSAQDTWLTAELAASTAVWKIVILHNAPYSSDINRSPGRLLWRIDFKGKGADVVFSGDGHSYERILVGGLPYFQCGLGGATRRGFTTPTSGSQFRFNEENGVLKIVVSSTRMQISMISVSDRVIDNVVIRKG